MAEESYEFVVAIPAGTTSVAPLIQPTTFQTRIVRAIKWTIPPGAVGFVGFTIGMRGVQLVPRNQGVWIVRSGESGGMPTHNHPTTGDWSVTAYNTGTYSHSLYITFEVDLYVPPPHRLVLAPASALSNPPPITSPIWGIDAST